MLRFDSDGKWPPRNEVTFADLQRSIAVAPQFIRRGKTILLLGAMVAAWPALSQSAGRVEVAGPAVLELFTSEGCNSCPPAEAVLGALSHRTDVMTLAFHVTYWDSASWHDRFGREDAVDRQARYVRAIGLPSPYTPQAVINGRVDELGSDAAGISRALASAPHPARVDLSLDAGGLAVRLPALPSQCPCTLQLIGTLAESDTSVTGGENTGRRLREFSIVRSIENAGAWDGVAAEKIIPLTGMAGDASTIVLLVARQRDLGIAAAGQIATRERQASAGLN